jgi:CHAT domain-containing protein
VLSACETAAGNDRAALGLAGVSLKAGARSTIASLWPISDEGTSLLMVDFYRNLQNGQSKSAALRTAQLKLINNPLFKHPNSWSPFLLIGNWL